MTISKELAKLRLMYYKVNEIHPGVFVIFESEAKARVEATLMKYSTGRHIKISSEFETVVDFKGNKSVLGFLRIKHDPIDTRQVIPLDTMYPIQATSNWIDTCCLLKYREKITGLLGISTVMGEIITQPIAKDIIGISKTEIILWLANNNILLLNLTTMQTTLMQNVNGPIADAYALGHFIKLHHPITDEGTIDFSFQKIDAFAETTFGLFDRSGQRLTPSVFRQYNENKVNDLGIIFLTPHYKIMGELGKREHAITTEGDYLGEAPNYFTDVLTLTKFTVAKSAPNFGKKPNTWFRIVPIGEHRELSIIEELPAVNEEILKSKAESVWINPNYK